MKVLIIGAGQIGQAIYQIVKPFHQAHIRDVEAYPLKDVKVLHICYPDGGQFVAQTKSYIEDYQPDLTIIHSSIAIGKTAECGERVVHCPVRGRHPRLAREIPVFTLFVGGSSLDAVSTACTYLQGCKLDVRPVLDATPTELCKLLSNVHMGLEIAWRQEVERMLNQFGVDSAVYEAWEESYLFGYQITGDVHLARPCMKPGPIGGHCILECVDLLAQHYESKLFDFIKDSNERVKNGLAQGKITEESASCSGYAASNQR